MKYSEVILVKDHLEDSPNTLYYTLINIHDVKLQTNCSRNTYDEVKAGILKLLNHKKYVPEYYTPRQQLNIEALFAPKEIASKERRQLFTDHRFIRSSISTNGGLIKRSRVIAVNKYLEVLFNGTK